MAEVSKTDVTARKLAKTREKFYGSCGHEVVPVRVFKRMSWMCVQGCGYTDTWSSRSKGNEGKHSKN